MTSNVTKIAPLEFAAAASDRSPRGTNRLQTLLAPELGMDSGDSEGPQGVRPSSLGDGMIVVHDPRFKLRVLGG